MGAALFFGRSGFRDWQLQRLIAEAEAALARADYAQASISVRRALQIQPDYVPACEQMAVIYEKTGDLVALTWRQRVVDLTPGAPGPLIQAAQGALRFGRLSVARSELSKVDDRGRQRADFQAVSGALAMASGDLAEAARWNAEAVRLDPQNASYRVDLGVAQSRSRDFFVREEGRRLLLEMAERPALVRESLRGLIASYEATQEYLPAVRLSRRLLEHPNPAFSDEVIHLKLLRKTEDPSAGEALANLQTKSEKSAAMATALVTWMNAEGLAAEVVAWAERAFPEITKTPGLRAAMAVALSATGDWPALLEHTKIGPWHEAEYGRQAYRARALREEGQIGLAHAAWKNAITAASSETDALAWLARMATEWNWPEENEEALLAMVGSSSKARAALKSLSGRYLAQENTAGLRRLASRLMEADPLDDDAQNDYAILSLLLDADVPRALRLARDLHQRRPDHAGYASTYAFALNYEGRAEEALRILEKLPPAKLEEPEFAVCYGMVLAANRLPEKARHYLQIARNAPLLREERHLVEKSLQVAGYVDPKSK